MGGGGGGGVVGGECWNSKDAGFRDLGSNIITEKIKQLVQMHDKEINFSWFFMISNDLYMYIKYFISQLICTCIFCFMQFGLHFTIFLFRWEMGDGEDVIENERLGKEGFLWSGC